LWDFFWKKTFLTIFDLDLKNDMATGFDRALN